ncbi:MAG: hypothetical protein GY871_04675 [Actinomycetales bacterium]|nr:hypothetical protein [Actinomycetales bacterium]
MRLDFYLTIDTGGEHPHELFSVNITHNVREMAIAAGIYQVLWRPEEIPVSSAAELIEPLADGIAWLHKNEAECRPLAPANGWGSWRGLIRFAQKVLQACQESPKASVWASR